MMAGPVGLFGLHARCFVRGYTGPSHDQKIRYGFNFKLQAKFHGRSVDAFCLVAPNVGYLLPSKTADEHLLDNTSRAQNSTLESDFEDVTGDNIS